MASAEALVDALTESARTKHMIAPHDLPIIWTSTFMTIRKMQDQIRMQKHARWKLRHKYRQLDGRDSLLILDGLVKGRPISPSTTFITIQKIGTADSMHPLS